MHVIPRDTAAQRPTARTPTFQPRAGEETHELTIRYLDRNGSPTQDALAVVSGWDSTVADWPVVNPDGTSTVRLPESGGGSFTVPAETADYRLEVADTRSTDDLTTQLSAAWTFRSGHTDGTVPARLPLAAVRFTPALDADDAAPANRGFDLPVVVDSQPGAPAPRISKLTVEISYDEGATWSTASVRSAPGGWTATVRHPAGAGFASLRATATDAAGTTVTQTVIRAYRIRVG